MNINHLSNAELKDLVSEGKKLLEARAATGTTLFLLTCDYEGWDYYSDHLIRANTVEEAREYCIVADEGAGAWEKAAVEIILPRGEAGVIISSFHAG